MKGPLVWVNLLFDNHLAAKLSVIRDTLHDMDGTIAARPQKLAYLILLGKHGVKNKHVIHTQSQAAGKLENLQ